MGREAATAYTPSEEMDLEKRRRKPLKDHLGVTRIEEDKRAGEIIVDPATGEKNRPDTDQEGWEKGDKVTELKKSVEGPNPKGPLADERADEVRLASGERAKGFFANRETDGAGAKRAYDLKETVEGKRPKLEDLRRVQDLKDSVKE